MELLDTMADYRGSVYRNILSHRVSVNLFDDLIDDAQGQNIANAAEMRTRSEPAHFIQRGFAYSEAVDYPFTADRVVASRYGDGTHRVWYGALDEATCLAETCYHQIQMLRQEDGIDRVVLRYRKVYSVDAQGLFLDLRYKDAIYPEILADDYAFTQSIGKRVAHQGIPGLLYPSARWRVGACLAAFRAETLSHPRELYSLTYRIHAQEGWVDVERTPGVVQGRLTLADLRRAD